MEADGGHEIPGGWKHPGRYVFMKAVKACERFSYHGTKGNFNNFPTYSQCMHFCSE